MVFVEVGISTTVPASRLVTYRTLPLELIAIALGLATAMVLTTAFVLVSMTVTVLLSRFYTYSFVPSGLIANACGVGPTAIVPITLLLVVSIPVTVPADRLVT